MCETKPERSEEVPTLFKQKEGGSGLAAVGRIAFRHRDGKLNLVILIDGFDATVREGAVMPDLNDAVRNHGDGIVASIERRHLIVRAALPTDPLQFIRLSSDLIRQNAIERMSVRFHWP